MTVNPGVYDAYPTRFAHRLVEIVRSHEGGGNFRAGLPGSEFPADPPRGISTLFVTPYRNRDRREE
jgi:hypothetical protein